MGTPLSNSMSELYVMQKYLQYDMLEEKGLGQFDAWAANFGETVVAMELSPEGKDFRMRTRFAKFFNIPELMSMFKESADIKTADVLNLDVPTAHFHTITTEASDVQKGIIDGLAERADMIRKGLVSTKTDNMLNIVNDGKKVALDQRLINDMLPDYEDSKVNICVDNVYKIYNETSDFKGTQIIFSDMSTPKTDGTFNVYDDIKNKLINKGIPENQIAFIHNYDTDEQKQKLMKKVRSGEIRILLGSTNKLGTGVNCQTLLKAVHHLDCPWRPSDLEQRNGRIIRQGNTNPDVDIFNYVTKGTFDADLYQIIESKLKFTTQILTSKSPQRVADDVDGAVLDAAMIKAAAMDNPLIKDKMELEIDIQKLNTLYSAYKSGIYTMKENISVRYPEQIKQLSEKSAAFKEDAALFNSMKTEEFSGIEINGKTYTDKREGGEALMEAAKKIRPDQKFISIGKYKGFELLSHFDFNAQKFNIILKNKAMHWADISKDPIGCITRLDNQLKGIEGKITEFAQRLENVQHQLEVAKAEITKPFERLDELNEKNVRLAEVNLEIEKLSQDNNETQEEKTDKSEKEQDKAPDKKLKHSIDTI